MTIDIDNWENSEEYYNCFDGYGHPNEKLKPYIESLLQAKEEAVRRECVTKIKETLNYAQDFEGYHGDWVHEQRIISAITTIEQSK